MKCSKCGTDNPSGAVCSSCGSPLIERLPEENQVNNNNTIVDSVQPQGSPPSNPFLNNTPVPETPVVEQPQQVPAVPEAPATPADPSTLEIPADFRFSDEPEEVGDDMDSVGVKIDDTPEEKKKKKKNFKRIRRKIRRIIRNLIIIGLIIFIIYYVVVHYIMPNDFIFGFFQ